jgi:methylmalonyl-CoA mutase N-terminal domain/subunit
VLENRDEAATAAALERLGAAATDEHENLMPHLLEAARVQATEGEMVTVLQEVFGSYSEAPVF